MKILGSVSLFVITICCQSCENFSLIERFYTITLRNKSETDVYFYTPVNASPEVHYPDTLLPQVDTYVIRIQAGKSFYIDSRKKWEIEFRDIPSDTLSIFFFKPDILEVYSWEKVREDYKILKRYDLSLQDLQKLEYTVPYPPTEAMRDMKMYPAYGN